MYVLGHYIGIVACTNVILIAAKHCLHIEV